MDVTLPEVMRKAGYATQLINDTPHLINYGFGFDRPFNCWWMIRGNEVDRWRTDHHRYRRPCESSRIKDMGHRFEMQHQRNIRDRVDAEEGRFCAQVFSTASRWLQDNYKQDFFLWIDSFDPHEPWDPPQHYIDMYDPGYEGNVITNFFNHETITPRELQHIRACYAAKVTMVDNWIGRLFDQIDRLGIAGDTVVAICSDHGTTLGDHETVHKRMPIYEENGHIVWMIRAPGVAKPGSQTDSLAQPPDLMPTMLDLAGLESDYARQGDSLVPILKDPGGKVRDITISGSYQMAKPLNAVTVNDGEWTFMRRLEPEEDELYHTAEDRGQTRNLAKDKPEIAKRLFDAMMEKMKQVNCPEWRMEIYRTRELKNVPKKTPLELRMEEQKLTTANFMPGELDFI
jgi:arylsulfatase A-like enzyme